jgi:phage shock protein B
MIPIFGMLTGVAVIFMVFVAPLWIIFHYRAQRRQATEVSPEEQATTETLTRVAERLEERVATLEKILDVEQPRWRQTHKDTGR